MLNAIITGATGGIGSAIARRLADGGYRVVLLGNKSADSLDKLQKRTCSPLALRGNLGNPSTVDNLIKQAMDLLGNVDLFVNCASISHVGLITEESNEGWAEILDANLSSTFYCSRAIVPYMIREQKGRILNISSVWGNVGASCEVAYSATKRRHQCFYKSTGKELAPQRHRCQCAGVWYHRHTDEPVFFPRMRSRKSVMRFRPAVWEIRKKSVKWPFFLPRLLFTSPARSSLWMADGSDHLTMVPPPSTYCSS